MSRVDRLLESGFGVQYSAANNASRIYRYHDLVVTDKSLNGKHGDRCLTVLSAAFALFSYTTTNDVVELNNLGGVSHGHVL